MDCPRFEIWPQPFIGTMHAFSIITVTVNVFGCYVILNKSPVIFGNYKWFLLAYQVLVTVVDVGVTTLGIPVIFYPFSVGYSAGLLDGILDPGLQISLSITSIVATMIAIGCLYAYRWNAVVPCGHPIRVSQTTLTLRCLVVQVFVCATAFTLMEMVQPDNRDEIKAELFQNYTCLREAIVTVPRLLAYRSEDAHFAELMGSLGILVFLLFYLVSAGHSTYILTRNCSHLSARTRQLQKWYLIALTLQLAIPTVVVIAPVVVFFYISWKKLFGFQAVGNSCMLVLSCHGTVGTLNMILMNTPYRRFVFRAWFPEDESKVRKIMISSVNTI